MLYAARFFKFMRKRYFLLAPVFLLACTHTSLQTQVVLPPSCDTTHVSYKNDIQPVLSANCYSCHATSQVGNGGGLDLESFSSLKTYLQYGFRGDGIYGSKFYHCICHTPLALPMPPTYILDSCSLRKVSSWIHLGAPQN